MVARKTVLKPAPARPKLQALLDQAKRRGVSEQELAEQRVSFAYGNAPADDDRITKESARTASTRNKLVSA
jgi:hypothetical protein